MPAQRREISDPFRFPSEEGPPSGLFGLVSVGWLSEPFEPSPSLTGIVPLLPGDTRRDPQEIGV